MYGQLLSGHHALAKANGALTVLGASHRLTAVAKHLLVGHHHLDAVDQARRDVSAMGLFLSGGTSNTDPNAALGDRISSTRMSFQSFVEPAGSVPGVTIKRIGNSSIGTGELQYERVGTDFLLRWVPSGSSATGGRLITGSGEFGILSADGVGTGFVVVGIDWDNVPTGVGQNEVIVQNILGNLFSEVTPAQAETGIVSYRCVYLKNLHLSVSMTNLKIATLKSGNTGSVVELGVDPAGVGDGITTGVATTPADETTDPGMSFGTEKALPTLAAGETVAIWMKRTIYEGWYKELVPDVHLMLLTGDI